jgi:hypothetical protein
MTVDLIVKLLKGKLYIPHGYDRQKNDSYSRLDREYDPRSRMVHSLNS